jgi:triacylglycerol esterase/lipase EstA (alpha/beta hydrolase family)
MSTYVLVHGAWHGSWCWDKVVPLLEDKGNKVILVNLPCHYDGLSPRKASIKLYSQAVEKVILSLNEPVILVGHSLGGMTITKVAEDIPDKIKRLIYVAAYIPYNTSVYKLNLLEGKAVLKHNYQYHPFKGYFTVCSDKIKTMFYQDCSDEDTRIATSKLCKEPLWPCLTKVKVTKDHYDKVRKAYISTAFDQTIPPHLQDIMIKNAGIKEVAIMKTGHSPFICKPKELTDLLLADKW